MKTVVLSISLLFLTISLFSQTDKKFSFEIASGLSLPLGEYASTDTNVDGASYATTGYYGGLTASYMVHNNIGISLSGYTIINPIDGKKMVYLFSTIDPSYDWYLDARGWVSSGITIGPRFSFKKDDFEFDIDLMAGGSSSTIPQLNVTATKGFDKVTVTQFNDKSQSFCLNLCGQVKYFLSETLAIKAGLGYIYTEPEFQTITNSSLGGTSTDIFNTRIATMNLFIGLVFAF